jgi:hypothetical protein
MISARFGMRRQPTARRTSGLLRGRSFPIIPFFSHVRSVSRESSSHSGLEGASLHGVCRQLSVWSKTNLNTRISWI